MISLFLPNLRGGGAERVCLDLADALAELGHQVEFVLMRAEGEFLPQAEARHSIVDLNVKRVRDAIRPLARHLRRRRPAGLIAAMWPLTVVAPLAARLSGCRTSVLVVEHNALSQQYLSRGLTHRLALRLSLALGFRMATARAAVSRGVADDAARLAVVAADRVRTLHNPIRPRPTPDSAALDRAETFWRSPPGKRIITVGSMKEQKNHLMLLQAFHLLGEPAANLLLLGKGALEPKLRERAAQLGIADRVIFAGFHPDPTPFYRTADLFVLSSNYEGFGNVIVEALTCRLPVVSTNCPSGPAEILENGHYGWLTPVGDAETLVVAMREALNATVDREALKHRGADFSPERIAKQYLELLFPNSRDTAREK